MDSDQQRTPVKGHEMFGDSSNRGFFNLNPNANPFFFNNERSDQKSTEMETPPGLGKPMPRNNFPGTGGYRLSSFGSTYSNTKLQNLRENPNPALLNISPIVFYGNDEGDMATPDKEDTPTHNRRVSYWNLNFGGSNMNPEGGISVSNLNTAIHSRADSKVTRPPEESNLEIAENLRFIEELLKDNDNEKSLMTNFTLDKTHESSFGGFQSPNISFTGITAIYPTNQSRNTHIKTQSEDFSTKNALKFSNTGHGRVGSVATTERKNE